MTEIPEGETRAFGDHAVLVGTRDATQARTVSRRVLAHWNEGEVVVGLRTVMLRAESLDAVIRAHSVIADVLAFTANASEEDEVGPLATIRCAFDGPDLEEAAEAADVAPDELIDLLTGVTLSVAMVGFSPGFAYLSGLPEPLQRIGRRSRPRPQVPAGSVAVANGHAAVYPSTSPGGWHLLGRSDAAMFDPNCPPYARLSAGDRVRFEHVLEVDPPPGPTTAAWTPSEGATPLFTVLAPGLRSVRQDGGRTGVAGVGVPRAGPADPDWFRLANRLVGNPDQAGALEVTAAGPTLRAEGDGFIALVGLPSATLDGQPVAAGRVVPVRTNQVLACGPLRWGLRAYLGVAGGLLGPQLFGSLSSDQLSGLGPGPLVAGERLYVGPLTPPLGDHLDGGAVLPRETPVVVRVVAGPHAEWFVPEALEQLRHTAFDVIEPSNRVGVRLRPRAARPSLRRAESLGWELQSLPMVDGAIQVPPAGEPVVLLTDHATHGGYPVIAVVVRVDLGRLGQLAPGDDVVLQPITLDAARQLEVEGGRILERAVVGHHPLAVE
ncbi:MAG TPA: carboxyltransferase domain-containing protein [Acidimicrobiales bacterium]